MSDSMKHIHKHEGTHLSAMCADKVCQLKDLQSPDAGVLICWNLYTSCTAQSHLFTV